MVTRVRTHTPKCHCGSSRIGRAQRLTPPVFGLVGVALSRFGRACPPRRRAFRLGASPEPSLRRRTAAPLMAMFVKGDIRWLPELRRRYCGCSGTCNTPDHCVDGVVQSLYRAGSRKCNPTMEKPWGDLDGRERAAATGEPRRGVRRQPGARVRAPCARPAACRARRGALADSRHDADLGREVGPHPVTPGDVDS